MAEYVVDSWAWVEYLDGSQKGLKVKDLVESNPSRTHTCSVSLAEVLSKFTRQGKDPELAWIAIRGLSKIVSVDGELARRAAVLHAKMRERISDFGLADAFVMATAEKLDAKIVTGDPHFTNVKGA